MRIALRLALFAAVAVVLALTLWPQNSRTPEAGNRVVSKVHDDFDLPRTMSRRLPRHATDVASNVLLFLPVGLLGALAFPHHRVAVAVAGPLASAGIETFQALWLPHRAGSLNDVLANSTGHLMGLAAAAAVMAVRSRVSSGRGNWASAR